MNALAVVVLEQTKRKVAEQVVKAAAISALSDAAIALMQGKEAKDIADDAACGTLTGAAGSGATLAFRHFVKRRGATSLVVGCVASVATRYAYRRARKGDEHL